ncbi:MAG: glycosyltransferase family 39 protein [Nanoarchaeota archaeon]
MVKELLTQRRILYLILIASFLIPLLSISIYQSFTYDEAAAIYNSWLELNGKHAFVDYFNGLQKPPAIIWISVPITFLFGNTFTTLLAMRVLSVLINVLTTWLVYLIALKLFKNHDKKEKIALVAALFFGISSLVNSVAGVLFTEPFTTFLMSLAFLIYLSDHKHKFLFSGIMIGAAGMFRQSPIIFAALLFLFILAYDRKDLLDKCSKYLAGLLIGFSPFLIYLFATNSFEAFFRSIITYQSYHNPVTPAVWMESALPKINAIINSFRWDTYLLLLLGIGLIFYMIKGRIGLKNLKSPSDKGYLFILLWLAVYSISFIFTGALFRHYLYEIMVPVVLITAKIFFDLGIDKKRIVGYLFILLVIFSVFGGVVYPLRIVDNTDWYLYQEFEKYNPETIFTDNPSILFLFGKTTDFYIWKEGETAYEKSGLDKLLGDRGMADAIAYANEHEPDIVYVYEIRDTFDNENYTKFSVTGLPSHSEFRYLLYIEIRKIVHHTLSIDKGIVPYENAYYVHNRLLEN